MGTSSTVAEVFQGEELDATAFFQFAADQAVRQVVYLDGGHGSEHWLVEAALFVEEALVFVGRELACECFQFVGAVFFVVELETRSASGFGILALAGLFLQLGFSGGAEINRRSNVVAQVEDVKAGWIGEFAAPVLGYEGIDIFGSAAQGRGSL
jgi:hypothetical protein